MNRPLYFCPTIHEVPRSLRSQTRVFGMGRENSEALARQLNALPRTSQPIVIYGCAGALRNGLNPGQTFQISRLITEGDFIDLPRSNRLVHLSTSGTCLLTSAQVLVREPEAKRRLHAQTQADLVDMEMQFLWQSAEEHIRERFIFVRGVIDPVDADLSFLNANSTVNWGSLLRPQGVRALSRFMKGLRLYRRAMAEFLSVLNEDEILAKDSVQSFAL